MSALDGLLGGSGERPTCRVISTDLAIHWFPSYEDGVRCFCGATTCTVEEDESEDGEALGYDIARPAERCSEEAGG